MARSRGPPQNLPQHPPLPNAQPPQATLGRAPRGAQPGQAVPARFPRRLRPVGFRPCQEHTCGPSSSPRTSSASGHPAPPPSPELRPPAFARGCAPPRAQLPRRRRDYLHRNPFCRSESFEEPGPSTRQRRGAGWPLPPPDARQEPLQGGGARGRRLLREGKATAALPRGVFPALEASETRGPARLCPSTAAPARRLLPGAWKGPQAGFGDSLPRRFRSGWGAWVRWTLIRTRQPITFFRGRR